MDFLNLPKVIGQAIYDIMMWILFFPVTLMRMVFRPRATLRYVEAQDTVEEKDAFSGAIRPSIFLVIAVIISSGMSVRDQVGAIPSSAVTQVLFASWTGSMASMMIMYCVVPLVGAVLLQMTNGQILKRKNLSVPFDQQCYGYDVRLLNLDVDASLLQAKGSNASLYLRQLQLSQISPCHSGRH